jgi:predicted DCC family thiol-disulfide oxidoreductase YuxK
MATTGLAARVNRVGDAQASARALVVFDSDCGFCSAVMRHLERWVPFAADVIPWQTTDLSALGTTPERAQREILWVWPDGRIAGGARAFAAMLHSAGGIWSPAGAVLSAPPVCWVAGAIYRIVARNRHKLPGGSPACALPPVGTAREVRPKAASDPGC